MFGIGDHIVRYLNLLGVENKHKIMAFQAKLPLGGTLKIANSDDKTQLSLQSDGESQSSSVSSGKWKQKPSVYETSEGIVVRIEGDETHFTAVKGSSINSLSSEPDLKDAKELSLEEISEEDAEAPHMKPMMPMEPLKPMAPMKPMGS